MIEIKIPDMGESITEAGIAAIIKQSGAIVSEGEEIVEIETEKVNQMLYAPVSGEISWKVEEGDSLAIGDVIGHIDTAKQEGAKPTLQKREEKAKPSPKEQVVASTQTGSQSRKKMTKIRKIIASRLVDALHKTAMLTTINEVDMSAVLDLREKNKESFLEKHKVKLGLMSFFVKAVVDALKAFPHFNAYIEGDEIVQRDYYDIGIAVGTDRGLVVPVARACDKSNFAQIELAIADFAKKAHSGELSVADLEGGGFTITNGGVYGSLLSTPILNPPQVGILGMHQIKKRAVVVDDQIVVRPMMYLALSYDHRLIDGKEAILFLVRIKELLENPAALHF